MASTSEKFNTKRNLNYHYDRHVKRTCPGEMPMDDMTKREYEQLADYTQRLPVDNSRVFGYEVERDGRKSYNKYDRHTGIFVAYFYRGNTPLTISCYKMDFNKFMRREKYKVGDIPEGK